MVLRTLETMGPQHGLGLAKRILQVSEGALDLNQGTFIRRSSGSNSEAGFKDSRASPRAIAGRLDALTSRGRSQIAHETESWARTVSLMSGSSRRGAGTVILGSPAERVPHASARPRARGPASSSSGSARGGISRPWDVDRRSAAGGQARRRGNRAGERGVSRRAPSASRRNDMAERAVRRALAPEEPGRHGGSRRHPRRRDRCNVGHFRRRQRRPAEAVAVSEGRSSGCDRAPGARDR